MAGEVEGLAPGLYHFCPGDFTLRRLRSGDVRAALAAAAADPSLARRTATIILSAIYWRNTWKYEARGYRHLFWDSGTMLANLFAVGAGLGLRPRLLTGFVDEAVNRLLGLDARREAALELVALGPEDDPVPPVLALEDIHHSMLPLSSSEVEYPLLREMYDASSLESASAVAKWRQRLVPIPRMVPADITPLPSPKREAGRSLGETIQRRGSTRRFARTPLSVAELSTTLWSATRAVDSDPPSGLVNLFLILNAVTDRPAGAYRYWPTAHGLEQLTRGDYRAKSAYLCLEQALGGDAAAVIYVLAPLDEITQSFGTRGYRLANLEAGIIGGRAYLAAYAQGFGASGLTFYDREVVEFFSPAAQGQDAIFVTALGRPARSAGDDGPVSSSRLQATPATR